VVDYVGSQLDLSENDIFSCFFEQPCCLNDDDINTET